MSTSITEKKEERSGSVIPTHLAATADVNRTEAPVTMKAYLMCAFASFGGIFFGYDNGYIGNVFSMPAFSKGYPAKVYLRPLTSSPVHQFTKLPYPPATPLADFVISSRDQSLITSILSAGTFFGAVIAGDCADFFGRSYTIIAGCMIFMVGVAIQMSSSTVPVLAAGRVIAGLGVGFESAVVILYMSEIAPKKVRGGMMLRLPARVVTR